MSSTTSNTSINFKDNFSRKILVLICLLFVYGFFLVSTANAAVITWDGGGADNNWSTGLNWSGDSAPGTTDIATFDATSTKAVSIDSAIDVAGIDINTGYTGTITQAAGVTINVRGSDFNADFGGAGAFVGGNSAFDVNSAFVLSAGTFTSTTDTLSVRGNFTVSGGSFDPSSGTVLFNEGLTTIIDVNTTETFNNLTINKNQTTDLVVRISASDTIVVAGTLTVTDGSISIPSSTSGQVLELQGNVVINDSNPAFATIIHPTIAVKFSGSNDQGFDLTGATAGLNSNLEIDKTGGAVTLASALTLDSTSQTLTVTNGTIDFNGNDLSVAGAFSQSNGTFTAGAGTITFGSSLSISGGTFNANASSISIAGAFSQTNGAFTGGTSTIDLNDNFSLSGGTFTSTSSTLYISGDWTHTAGGTFDANSGLIEFDGTAHSVFDVNSTETFYSFNINKTIASNAALQISNSDTLVVTGTGQISEGNLSIVTATSGQTVEFQGDVVINDSDPTYSTFVHATLAVKFSGSNAQSFDLTGATGGVNSNITIDKTSGTVTLASNLTLDSTGQTLTVTNGTIDLNGNDLSVAGAYSQSGGTFTAGAGTLTFSNSVSISGGSFNADSSTISMTGAFDQSGGTFSGSSSGIDMNSSFSLSLGTFTSTSGTLSLRGDFTVSGGTFDPNSGTVVFNEGLNTIIDINSTETFSSVTVNKNQGSDLGVRIANGDTVVVTGTMTVTDGDISVPAETSGQTLEMQGNVVINDSNPAYTTVIHPNITFKLSGTADQSFDLTGATGAINGTVELDKSSGVVTLSSDLILDYAGQDLTITNGTLSILANALTVAGTFSNSGTLRMFGANTLSLTLDTDSGTVEYTGDGGTDSDTYTITSLSTTYYNLTINSTDGASDTFELGSDLNVNNHFILTAGTFDVTAMNRGLTVGGNFANSGTFVARSGTVTLNDVTKDSTVSGSTTFYNFTASTSGKTIYFTAGTTQTVSNLLTLTGSLGNLLTLRSTSSGSAWYLVADGTYSVSYVDVKDSDASGGTEIINRSHYTNSGSNPNWTFNVVATATSVAGLQETDGSGHVGISFVVDDYDDDDTVQAKIEFNSGTGWVAATMLETSGTGSTFGLFNVENDNTYQVGNASGYISTSSGPNTITAVWDSASDLDDADTSTAQIRITTYDGFGAGTATASSNFLLDQAAPSGGLTSLSTTSTSTTSIGLTWDEITSETNFSNYKVYYKTSVVESYTLFETISAISTSTSTITGLSAGTTYNVYVKASDTQGNSTSSSVISVTLPSVSTTVATSTVSYGGGGSGVTVTSVVSTSTSQATSSDDSVETVTESADTNMTDVVSVAGVGFSDIANDFHVKAINYLHENNIVNGYSDGTFKPKGKVNRAEFLKVLLGLAYPENDFSKSTDCFNDVTNEWFAGYVCFASQKNVVSGYQDKSFQPSRNVTLSEALKMTLNTYGLKPDETSDVWYLPYYNLSDEYGFIADVDKDPSHEITRGEMAQLIFAVKSYVDENSSQLSDSESDVNFVDIANNLHASAITYLYNKEIVKGYADKSFKPNKTINRAEFVKILVGAAYSGDYFSNMEKCFSDVNGEWFSGPVCFAYSKDIVSGYQDGSFRPANNVTLAEALKISLETYKFEMTESSDLWYLPYFNLAIELGFLEDVEQNPDHEISRGEMAELIYSIDNYLNGTSGDSSDSSPETEVVDSGSVGASSSSVGSGGSSSGGSSASVSTTESVSCTDIFYADTDLDGYGDANSSVLACAAPDAYVSIPGDCNDMNATIHPGATEVPYNGADDDCNGATLDDDLDQDGYTAEATGGTDCNDSNSKIYNCLDRGTWSWGGFERDFGNSNVIGNASKEDTMIEYMKAYGIQHVYAALQDRPVTESNTIAAWVKKLHENGIDTYYLLGDNVWPCDWSALLPNLTDRVIDYNKSRSDPLERFDGLHFDVEPQALNGDRTKCPYDWSAETVETKREILGLLADMYDAIRAHLDSNGASDLPVYADLPFWFDNHAGQTFSWASEADAIAWFNRLSSSLEGISIMAYCYDSVSSMDNINGWEIAHFNGEVRLGINVSHLVGNGRVCSTWNNVGEAVALGTALESYYSARNNVAVDIYSFSWLMEGLGF